MELGALVCVPNGAPLCDVCPLAGLCQARAAGTTARAAPEGKAEAPQGAAGDGGAGGKPGGLSGTAAARKRDCWPGCGSRCCGRANTFCRPKCWQGWQPLEWTPAPQCRKPCPAAKHIFSPHRMAAVRCGPHGAGAGGPGGLRLGQPRGAAHHLHPARVPLPPTRTGCWDDLEILAICPKLFVQNGQEAKKLPATVVIFDRERV